ncbi:MAG: hypothetical protein HY377_02210 [Candidatus Blackburnbacteria bacterium]|nr:hypothetical protein [Candidatus Blackburnbacteria bacterium]
MANTTLTTQHHLLVADITDDIVLTKDGGAALVLKSSAVNFSLLSEKEQGALIFAYAALLNSLSFPIQILVRSRRKDISNYLKFLEGEEGKQTNPKLKGLMSSYRNFVTQVVKKRNVLDKDFYIVIPFSPLELGISPLGIAKQILPNAKRAVPYSREYVVKKAKIVLYPRRDHLLRQVGRLGLKLEQLGTEELASLLFKVYNPVGDYNPEGNTEKKDVQTTQN